MHGFKNSPAFLIKFLMTCHSV